MEVITRSDAQLWMESVALEKVAEKYGTPTYVYSQAAISQQYLKLKSAFDSQANQICYAVKANSNIGILSLLARLGAGFDVVSAGELERVLQAGGDVSKVIFSGVGKSTAELDFALKLGIQCINVESSAELNRLEERARLLERVAPISIRINPDIDAKTHPYISTGLSENKFGVTSDAALDLYEYAQQSEYLQVYGIDCHIGSQITELAPLLDAAKAMLLMVDRLKAKGIPVSHINMGGGIGVNYGQETVIDINDYAQGLEKLLKDYDLKLLLEPGRYLVANAGVLLTRVEYLKLGDIQNNKTTNFAIVDAAMNDLLRPALYQAQHTVLEVVDEDNLSALGSNKQWDLVGPICESADFLAKNCSLNLQQGSLLSIMTCGAYGFSQSSNYNSRNRAAEIVISGDKMHLIRRRESINDQLSLEKILPLE